MKILFLVTALFLTGTAAQAYVPPPHFILDRMMKSREGLKALELVAEVKDLQRNVIFNETLRLDFTGARFWTVVTEPSGAVAASHFGKLTELKSLGLAWIEIGYDPNQFRFREALQSMNVWPTDKSETRLTREGNKVQWVWGDENQLKIEKDQFVFAGFMDDDKNEILVRDQARFPRVVLVRTQGQDKFQYTLKGFKINPAVKWNNTTLVPAQGALVDPVSEWVSLVR